MRSTIIDLFNTSVKYYANNPFLWEKETTEYKSTTYNRTKELVHQGTAGLIKIGVKQHDKIALLSEGRNAWIISELAILHTGAVNVPLSVKLEESNDLAFRLNHSESKFIFVSGGQLNKIRSIYHELPLLQRVIVFDEQAEYLDKEMSWKELLELGQAVLSVNHSLVEDTATKILPDDIATICYTSGTTADPKGVMLTHRNYTANVEQALGLVKITPAYRTLIILPLDHCFAHVAGFYSFMSAGASVATVQAGKTGVETLKNIPVNIKEFKPHILLSVPALAKNFKKNIDTAIKAQGKTAYRLYKLGLRIAYAYNKEGHNKGESILGLIQKPLIDWFDKIIFSKIRENFGGQLEFFIGGGAYLDIDLQRYFYAIGIPMFQGYGLSEATPIISSNNKKKHKLGTSGTLVKNLSFKICDDEGHGLGFGQTGEIIVKGENIMAGYYKNEKATEEVLKEGWLHTGDMGYMDEEKFLYVIGRFKSLLISSDGEKYSPEGIEESIIENSNHIDQVILHNNQNPYTVALVVPQYDTIKRHLLRKKPTIDLKSEEAKQLALEMIQHDINQFKKGGKYDGMYPERWLPAAIAILPEPMTEQNGLVNSTMKVMRNKVVERYADRLDTLYAAGGKNIINKENIAALNL